MKDYIIIGVVAFFALPLMYIAALFATGNARIEFGRELLPGAKSDEVKYLESTARRDSLAVQYSRTYLALKKEREEVEQKKEELQEQQERLEIVRREVEQQQKELEVQKERLEKLVESSGELSGKRIKQLARIYEAMKANEAANILETIDDDLVISILRAMSDDRQKAKIVAGLPENKARRISAKMGKPVTEK